MPKKLRNIAALSLTCRIESQMTVGRRMSRIITADKTYMKSGNVQAGTSITSELLAGFADLQYLYSDEKILLTFGVTHANKI